LLLLGIMLLTFIFTVLLVNQIWPSGKRIPQAIEEGEIPQAKPRGPLTRLMTALIKIVGRSVEKLKFPFLIEMERNIKTKLGLAGNPGNFSPSDFIAIQILAGIGLLFLVMILFETTNLIYLLLALLVGFYFPNYWLKEKINIRHKIVFRSLPDALDLLTLCVEAGLDFGSAVNKLVERGEKGPLEDEFFNMQQEIRMGKSRVDALRDMAQRIDHAALTQVVNSLIQAIQLGGSLASILRTQSDQMRTQRFLLAEKLAAEAPIKLLFPLLFFIFPTIFIILFGPIALMFLKGGF